MSKVRVWDLPTRVFHWTLLASVVALFVTANIGGNMMEWHMRTGYLVAALLIFRVLWGFIGGHWSRFSSFFPTPARLTAYLKEGSSPGPGHNPLGALSVFAMLSVLFAQVASGLVSDDEIAFTGPLYQFVSNSVSSAATAYHTEIGKVLLIALVVLHVLAIAYYQRIKKKPLVQAMITGDQEVSLSLSSPSPMSTLDTAGRRIFALLLFVVCLGLILFFVQRVTASPL
jgi:cytochrome b